MLKRIDFFYNFIYNGNNKKKIMLNLIVDPKAGKGLAVKNIKIVSKYLKKEKIPYLVYFIEKEADILDFASSLSKTGETDFIFISDDDTIHNFINNLAEPSKAHIGIIPSGIYNSFAKSLHLEFKPIKAIQNILENKLEKFDYLKCNDKIALSCVAFGAVEAYENKLMTEKNKSKLSLIEKIKAFKVFEPVQLNFSGKDLREKNVVIKECYIANGLYKDKLNVSPLSNPQDGLCNVICVTPKEKEAPLKEYISIRRAKHIYIDTNKVFWTSDFSLTSSNVPITTKIDGIFYNFDEITIKVVEEGLNIYVEK